MAYCDYLFRRSSGIFYFRYVLKFQNEKPREVRISLNTRSYGLAKQLAASCFVNLKHIIIDREKSSMNADEWLTKAKIEMMKGIDPNNHEHLSRFEEAYSEIERKLFWVKEHVSDKFEGQSIKSIIKIYNEYAPIFNQVQTESNRNQREKIEVEIWDKARKHYGLEFKINSTETITDKINKRTSGLKVSEVARLYSDEMMKGGNWKEKTFQENMVSFNLFCELQGDICLNEIGVRNITDFKAQLRNVPKNFRKLPTSREKSLSRLVQESHGLPIISVSSINKHLTKISTLLNWGKINGYCKENSAIGISIKQRKNAQEDRLPFTDSELSQIFSSKIYRNRKNLHTYHFWLPLLALFTGARINELCQLDVSDIKESEGIHYIDINDKGDKSIKNLSSNRNIPIHSNLIKIGFLEFVESAKKKGAEKVFTSIKKGRDGYGTAPSKWFGRYKENFILENKEKKTFHSFRHNFSDAMKSADIPLPIAQQLFGHKGESITYSLYGSGSALNQLKTYIEKVEYKIKEIENLKY